MVTVKQRARYLALTNVSLMGKLCERCGSTRHLRRHHEDYSRPLDVTILCQSCHMRRHHELGDIKYGRTPGRRAKYEEHLTAVVQLAQDTTLTYDQIGAEVGIPGWAARRLHIKSKEKAAPREGNGQASSKEEDAGQSIPAAIGSASPAEGGKL